MSKEKLSKPTPQRNEVEAAKDRETHYDLDGVSHLNDGRIVVASDNEVVSLKDGGQKNTKNEHHLDFVDRGEIDKQHGDHSTFPWMKRVRRLRGRARGIVQSLHW